MEKKPQLTDKEFEVLKKRRDEDMKKFVDEIWAEHFPNEPRKEMHAHVHISGAGGCYCACPDGPCQHKWDGPEVTSDSSDQGFWSSGSCSKCGAIHMYHDMKVMP